MRLKIDSANVFGAAEVDRAGEANGEERKDGHVLVPEAGPESASSVCAHQSAQKGNTDPQSAGWHWEQGEPLGVREFHIPAEDTNPTPRVLLGHTIRERSIRAQLPVPNAACRILQVALT